MVGICKLPFSLKNEDLIVKIFRENKNFSLGEKKVVEEDLISPFTQEKSEMWLNKINSNLNNYKISCLGVNGVLNQI